MTSTRQIFKGVFYVSSVLVLFLISIDLLVTSLGHIGKDTVNEVLQVTANPFVSLFIGLLITALIQSSSTTTSMIVAMVAAGSLEMHQAIPMLMGANIGTTLTSNIVSLSFISDKPVFRRAFSAATLHDHFNILTTIVVFPLQAQYHFLEVISEKMTHFLSLDLYPGHGINFSVVKIGNLMISEWLVKFIGNPVVLLVISGLLLFGSIKLFTNIIYKMFIGAARLKFENLIFRNPAKSFGWGTIITAALQSSSVTTSFVVPLVATGKIKLRGVYPFIVGANVGTTITALLAALFKSPEAISIAVAHFLFNVVGGFIFLVIPGINRLPLIMADLLGDLTMKYRIIGLIYLILTFFLLPFAFIYLTK